MKFALVAVLLLASAMPASAKIYGNARFGFFVDVPAQFSIADPEPENGDGRAFHTADKSADLTASGGWIMGDNFAADVSESKGYDTQDGWTLAYESKVGTAAASWSGKKGDRIFYQRMIASCKGKARAGYRLEYPAVENAKYDATIKSLNASLKAGTGSCD
ncbi:hypothetical protein [Aestuariivirga litoralis]|uniref:hypothetical protein n=1 Tax=Aestuariivirga litoralis TaxID=2650924 RepID=UPI0018C80F4E|nr:hypothetical protein [Aestuariivirga litoralis]MBG1231351.1 hypothetical protein [Aestuariivirga litoralis]